MPVPRLEPAPFLFVKNLRVPVGGLLGVAARSKNQFVVNHEVGGEEDPVLMLDKEPVHLLRRVSPELRNARGDIGHHVRVALQRPVDPIDVLRVVREVNADEGGVAVAGDDAIESFEQLQPWRVDIGIAEPPVAMILEFLPALVRLVEGQPERLGVADVDGDGHPQFPAAPPDGIQFRIVDLEQPALAIAQEKAETFELLQSGGAQAIRFFHLLHCPLGEVGLIPALVIEIEVVQEAPWKKQVGQLLVPLELRGSVVGAPGNGTAAEVDHQAQSDGVHYFHRERQVLRGAIDVLVQIDGAVFRPPEAGLSADSGDVVPGGQRWR